MFKRRILKRCIVRLVIPPVAMWRAFEGLAEHGIDVHLGGVIVPH